MEEILLEPSHEGDYSDDEDYAQTLRTLLSCLLTESGTSVAEVEGLRVFEPLAERWDYIRNGVEVPASDAQHLLVNMVISDNPGFSCELVVGHVSRVRVGWDGGVHLYLPREIANVVAEHLESRDAKVSREVTAAFPQASLDNPVTRPTDSSFWSEVRERRGSFTLLCERWAEGPAGFRWFRINDQNLDSVVARIEQRSLVFVVVNPDLELSESVIDEGFTAFSSPLLPGELAYEKFGFADDVAVLRKAGYDLALPDSDWGDLCAVVPDIDGIVPMTWDW